MLDLRVSFLFDPLILSDCIFQSLILFFDSLVLSSVETDQIFCLFDGFVSHSDLMLKICELG